MLDVKIEKNKKINNNLNNVKKENELNNLEINHKNYLINLNNSEKIKKNYLNLKKINKNNIKINFIKLDNRIFKEIKINISEINSQEELIEKINSIEKNREVFYKIILAGTRNLDINKNKICKLIENKSVIKIEDETEIKYDLDKLAKQNNLKGIFVKKLLDKLNDENYNQNEVKRAIEIGLKSFE